MKKLKLGVVTILVLSFGIACNLTAFMSETPPFQWEKPIPTAQSSETTIQNSCISQELIPENYSKDTNLKIINIDDITQKFETALNKLFPDAKVTQTDTYIHANQKSAINCVVISPLSSMEETVFDLLIGKPEIVEKYFQFPNIETQTSKINNLIQNLGDSRSAFHIEVPGKNIQLELIIYRQDENIFFVNFFSDGSDSSQKNLIELATNLQ